MNWISIKDKLPEIEKYVLVCYKNNVFQGYLDEWEHDNCWYIFSGSFTLDEVDYNIKLDEVTHWMPLPEPPEELK